MGGELIPQDLELISKTKTSPKCESRVLQLHLVIEGNESWASPCHRLPPCVLQLPTPWIAASLGPSPFALLQTLLPTIQWARPAGRSSRIDGSTRCLGLGATTPLSRPLGSGPQGLLVGAWLGTKTCRPTHLATVGHRWWGNPGPRPQKTLLWADTHSGEKCPNTNPSAPWGTLKAIIQWGHPRGKSSKKERSMLKYQDQVPTVLQPEKPQLENN
mmetsp:Transcript_9126/g.12095  ORF Transcript_9126/g.12095 Transcript_9126/m.12095 type:complete len:215 (+) Transcript_9126:400-1044(+)